MATPEILTPVLSSHDRILAAAKRLFASQGYEATSTMAIARLAGTSESQMMKHFGSKEGLLEAILDAGWQSMSQAL
ncbi:MAG TPA: helix-turn-helix domain-containing protein, partial [Terriglobales bacterium]|nr:helix-turn-helix domain-containing protein [Terriglobales bacterium]